MTFEEIKERLDKENIPYTVSEEKGMPCILLDLEDETMLYTKTAYRSGSATNIPD